MHSLSSIIERSLSKVNPLLPLKSWVAVNPYQGWAHLPFEEAAAHLKALANIEMTMPLSFYLEQLDEQHIHLDVLEKVLRKHEGFEGFDAFMQAIGQAKQTKPFQPTYTFLDHLDAHLQRDLLQFFTKRISLWAASYFDEGQATWKVEGPQALFESWKAEALIDRNYKIAGLQRFTEAMAILPSDEIQRISLALNTLHIEGEANTALYFDRLLKWVPGWTAYIANIDREAQLRGERTGMLQQFLSILTSIDLCLYFCELDRTLEQRWMGYAKKLHQHFETAVEDRELNLRLILHEAYEETRRRNWITAFHTAEKKAENPEEHLAQVAFCIDVRSEIVRRHLEQVEPRIQTIGYAGFFGFPFQLKVDQQAKPTLQSPALLFPSLQVEAKKAKSSWKQALQTSRLATYTFKKYPLSGFGFVSPRGLYQIWPTLQAWRTQKNKTQPTKDTCTHYVLQDLSLEELTNAAENTLRGMGLSTITSKFVVFIGHGSTSKNNPMAAGLNCGACGGNSGEANARIAAEVMNREDVRRELQSRGIVIPAHTQFLAGVHDTTTDRIHLNSSPFTPMENERAILTAALEEAGMRTRLERASALQLDTTDDLSSQYLRKSADWSEIRPEWGLSTCTDFIIADRKQVQHANLGGSAFLHDYNRHADPDNRILEQIMTAPLVVTSWINLQYYASTVDPQQLGAGNKTLHNVTAGNAIIEGASSDIKMGLALESVHNGRAFYHQPHKLNVVIAARPEDIEAVLRKHALLRNLFQNGWLNLMHMNDHGVITSKYRGSAGWDELEVIEKNIELAML